MLLRLLAIFYLVAAFFWSMPEGFPLKTQIVAPATGIFRWAGLWQNWSMFAPNPLIHDVYLSVRATYVDGDEQVSILSKMPDYSYFRRYAHERWRKWANDNLRLDSNSFLWPNAAKFLAKKMDSKEKNPLIKLEILDHWREVGIPTDTNRSPTPGQWKERVLYTYTDNYWPFR